MGLFNKEIEHHYHVYEIKQDAKLPELNDDLRNGLKALAINPYFQYLLQRFRFKKAAMQTTLNEGFKLDDKQLRYCQAGIYWAGDIERDIQLLTQEQPQRRPAQIDELAEFRKVSNAITLVGDDSSLQG